MISTQVPLTVEAFAFYLTRKFFADIDQDQKPRKFAQSLIGEHTVEELVGFVKEQINVDTPYEIPNWALFKKFVKAVKTELEEGNIEKAIRDLGVQ